MLRSRARPRSRRGSIHGQVEFYSPANKFAAILGLEHDLDLDGSFAYSDSVTDLPMLETVGHPVAVNLRRALLKGTAGVGRFGCSNVRNLVEAEAFDLRADDIWRLGAPHWRCLCGGKPASR